MKNIKMKRISFWSAIVILLLFVGAIYWSPYGIKSQLKKRAIISSIVIEAPVHKVYDYLGDSYNASDWSVFVDSILPLNSISHDDGSLGSQRRCFAGDQTLQWDEEIVSLEKYKVRELSVFNIIGFLVKAENLRTEQIYEEINEGQTKLSLTLYYKVEMDDLLSELKMYLAAYEVSKIFRLNLKNIKRLNEC